jgi:2-dehydrotetronate isomerase
MRLKLSANLGFLWKELPLPQRIANAALAGFDAVEMHDDWQEYDSVLLAEALVSARLPVESINTTMAGNAGIAAVAGKEAEARAAIDRALAAARTFGARAVHVTAGKAERNAANTAAYIANLRHACAGARSLGISVLIEPIADANISGYFLSTPAFADEIMAELPDSSLLMLFDCFHVATLGLPIEETFSSRATRIGHVQIAGFPGRGEPSTGTLDYAKLLPALVAGGYCGAFGAEYRPADTVESGLGWMQAFR